MRKLYPESGLTGESLPGGPLVAIVGATASGKSELAERLAKIYDGELISADSRQLYRGLDIATAKPAGRELPDGRYRADSGAIYHLVSLREPDEIMDLALYQRLARRAWRDILERGKLPILVGGTGLYTEAVIADLRLPAAASDHKLRRRLKDFTHEELLARLRALDPGTLTLPSNRRRVIRAIEILSQGESRGTRPRPDIPPQVLLMAVKRSPEELQRRIAARVEEMLELGLLEEVRRVTERYSPELPALSAVAYPIFAKYLGGEISLVEASLEFIRADYQLARRQLTWWRHRSEVHWIRTEARASRLVTRHLQAFPPPISNPL